MASFNFTVDTEPMARTLDGVTRRVDGVTTAVVTMQTAVVLAEKQAADNISRNVNKGFYTLIKSQISQKLARLRSEVESKLMEMAQQSAALASIKSQMEKDYNMIAARYTKLFNSLNKSLKTRVFELDRPTTNFTVLQIEPTANRLRAFLGKVPVQQSECVNTSQLIASSHTKSNALKAINAIKDFISSSKQQKALVSQILFENADGTGKKLSLPFAVCESIGLTVRQPQWDYFTSAGAGGVYGSRINRVLQAQVFTGSGNLNWGETSKAERERVSAVFIDMLGKSGLSERLKGQVLKLHENNNWQTLKN